MGKTIKHTKSGTLGLFSDAEIMNAKNKTRSKNRGLRQKIKSEVWRIPYEHIPYPRFTRSETESTL